MAKIPSVIFNLHTFHAMFYFIKQVSYDTHVCACTYVITDAHSDYIKSNNARKNYETSRK